MGTIIALLSGCFFIGVILSAPMGPVGILCVQRTLNKGRESGFFTGIGAAASDLIYCLLTGLGMSIVTDFIETNQSALQIIGSLLLLAYSIYLVKHNPTNRSIKEPSEKKQNHVQDAITGFLFTFSNPLIIFLIIPLFARFNFPVPDYPWYVVVVGYLAIVLGALAWWAVITYFVNKVRTHFNIKSMVLINRLMGIFIMLLAAYGLFSGVNELLEAANIHAL